MDRKLKMDVSIVIPTYNEKENVQRLLEKIYNEFREHKINGEVIVVDDGSPDGTGSLVENLKKKYKTLQIIHRKGKMGLSSAVLEGFAISKSNIIGGMDADLSHPTEKINEMYLTIKNNEVDLVIGSRYIKEGRIEGWGLYRKILSKLATLLARVFTSVKDPMTGYFFIKKECLNGINLNPRGFKILLEILIKAKYKNVKEIPITFINRTEGKSKAGMGEIIYYLENLIGYLPYKKKVIKEFFKFAFVGLVGTFINIVILYSLTEFLGIYYMFSEVFAFIIAATSNFFLNKIWTFKERVKESILNKYLLFLSVSITALIVNLFFLYILTEFLGIYYIISQFVSIGIALMINFLGNKIWTFRK